MLCPHCNQSLETRKVKGRKTALDYCTLCEAAWFEKGELPELLGHDPDSGIEIPDNPIRLDNALCPECTEPLLMFAYPGTGRVIEGCGTCEGVWIDREDLDEIRALPAPEPKPKPEVQQRTARSGGTPQRSATERSSVVQETRPAPPPRAVVRERIRYSERYGLAFSKLLLQWSSIRVDQEIPDWAETKLGLVAKNTYRVRSLRGSTLGWVEEQGEGLRAMIRRTVKRRSRNFTMNVLGSTRRELILKISRDRERLLVETQSRKLGEVVRQGDGPPNGWELNGPDGKTFARVSFQSRPGSASRGPADWEFPIIDGASVSRGTIIKKWGGAWKETTSDSDNFRVDYGTHRWTPEERAVIFASVFAIDFDLFEDDNPDDGPKR